MTVKIKAGFTGYPDGKKARHFAKDEEVADLTKDYEALLVEKGLASIREVAPRKELKT